MEESTTLIADRIAQRLKGASLTWSRREQFRTELKWSLCKRRGLCHLLGNECGLLDPSNRDPNFLKTTEIVENEWFHKMVFVRNRFKGESNGWEGCAHVDIHGCKDPPAHAGHLHIGMGAMRQALKGSTPKDLRPVQELAIKLKVALTEVVMQLNLAPVSNAVSFILPLDVEQPPGLSGAWRPSLGRHTQTQQSISFAGFSHSIQMEMSLSLRKALVADSAACEKFADAISTVLLGVVSDPRRAGVVNHFASMARVTPTR